MLMLTWTGGIRQSWLFFDSHIMDEGVLRLAEDGEVVWSAALDLLLACAELVVVIEVTNAWDVLWDCVDFTQGSRAVRGKVTARIPHIARIGCRVVTGSGHVSLIRTKSLLLHAKGLCFDLSVTWAEV